MGLLAYSGITTKVRAMESRLLKPEQFQELAEQEDVRSAADYLKAQPAYAEVFEGLDDTKLHRGYMEQILTQSEYRDFTRLYRFSGVKQRRFLDLYFKHYEVEVIKKLLRHVLGGREGQPDLSMFQDFFEKHSDLNLELLCRAKNFSEFTEALEGTVYGAVLFSFTLEIAEQDFKQRRTENPGCLLWKPSGSAEYPVDLPGAKLLPAVSG